MGMLQCSGVKRLQKRCNGCWRNDGKSMCAFYLVGQTPGLWVEVFTLVSRRLENAIKIYMLLAMTKIVTLCLVFHP